MPLAVLEPAGGPSASAAPDGGEAAAGVVAEAGGAPERRRVRIYLNGSALPSKTSVVQSLVGHASRVPPGRGLGEESLQRLRQDGARGCRPERFLAVADEGGSDSEDSRSAGSRRSQRNFCGTIWGRVHGLTYEILDGPGSPRETASGPCSPTGPRPEDEPAAFVATDFAALVQRHARAATTCSGLERRAPQGAAAACAGAEPEEEQPAPQGSGPWEDGDLTSMLRLISAFHNVCEYLRARPCGLAADLPDSDEPFHCHSLTSVLMRQLSDPMAVCTGSVPAWCAKLAGSCRFLFPCGARRVLHHSCNLGLSRALQHVQQRALAQHAHNQESQRRLEGEVSVASIPRQKVRIPRQRMLESAIKVMNLYGRGSAILEVEYVGEVGTGSGPTLEFYAQVADTLRTSEPQLFRSGAPGAALFPEPRDPAWLAKGEDQAAQQILERFRLLGHTVAKCILDSRLVDVQLHPFLWRAALGSAPFHPHSLRELDPELAASLARLGSVEADALAGLCVDFTLPGHPEIELRPGGASVALTTESVEEYVNLVAEATLVTAVAPQVDAFRTAFQEVLPLEACHIWSEKELAAIIMGASVRDDSFWTFEHLSAHIKAQHGYDAESRCFRDLLQAMADFKQEERRSFLTFVTGAPALPIGGFAGLKPPLTVVKKEAPPAPLTPDQFMPSVMTCANYLKLPEYTAAATLRQKLALAMSEGQSAFLLS